MRYRNIKTGAEIEVRSIISAPDWIKVDADLKGEGASEAPSPKKTTTKKTAASKKGAKK